MENRLDDIVEYEQELDIIQEKMKSFYVEV